MSSPPISPNAVSPSVSSTAAAAASSVSPRPSRAMSPPPFNTSTIRRLTGGELGSRASVIIRADEEPTSPRPRAERTVRVHTPIEQARGSVEGLFNKVVSPRESRDTPASSPPPSRQHSRKSSMQAGVVSTLTSARKRSPSLTAAEIISASRQKDSPSAELLLVLDKLTRSLNEQAEVATTLLESLCTQLYTRRDTREQLTEVSPLASNLLIKLKEWKTNKDDARLKDEVYKIALTLWNLCEGDDAMETILHKIIDTLSPYQYDDIELFISREWASLQKDPQGYRLPLKPRCEPARALYEEFLQRMAAKCLEDKNGFKKKVQARSASGVYEIGYEKRSLFIFKPLNEEDPKVNFVFPSKQSGIREFLSFRNEKNCALVTLKGQEGFLVEYYQNIAGSLQYFSQTLPDRLTFLTQVIEIPEQLQELKQQIEAIETKKGPRADEDAATLAKLQQDVRVKKDKLTNAYDQLATIEAQNQIQTLEWDVVDLDNKIRQSPLQKAAAGELSVDSLLYKLNVIPLLEKREQVQSQLATLRAPVQSRTKSELIAEKEKVEKTLAYVKEQLGLVPTNKPWTLPIWNDPRLDPIKLQRKALNDMYRCNFDANAGNELVRLFNGQLKDLVSIDYGHAYPSKLDDDISHPGWTECQALKMPVAEHILDEFKAKDPSVELEEIKARLPLPEIKAKDPSVEVEEIKQRPPSMTEEGLLLITYIKWYIKIGLEHKERYTIYEIAQGFVAPGQGQYNKPIQFMRELIEMAPKGPPPEREPKLEALYTSTYYLSFKEKCETYFQSVRSSTPKPLSPPRSTVAGSPPAARAAAAANSISDLSEMIMQTNLTGSPPPSHRTPREAPMSPRSRRLSVLPSPEAMDTLWQAIDAAKTNDK